MSSYLPSGGKVDLTPRRHHGYAVVLFIFGTLFPPLGEYDFQWVLEPIETESIIVAVAARFGVGSDFWLNLLLTICGYIPGEITSVVEHRREGGTCADQSSS